MQQVGGHMEAVLDSRLKDKKSRAALIIDAAND